MPAATRRPPAATLRQAGAGTAVARAAVPARVLASGLLLLTAASWVPPYLADRAQNRAVERGGEGRAGRRRRVGAQRHAAGTRSPPTRWSRWRCSSSSWARTATRCETLRAAADLQPQNYVVHYQLGLLLERAYGRSEEAAAAFRRALELNPLHESSAYELERLVAGGG